MSELPISRKFLYDLDELYTKRKAKEITEEEFSVQRDALVTQEAKLHETVGPLLVRKQIEALETGVATIVDKKFQKEEQAESERVARERFAKIAEKNRIEQEEQAKQKAIRLENQRRIDDRDRLRQSLDIYIFNLDDDTNLWQRWFNRLQISLIILTTATASLAGFDGIPRIWVVIFGFAAASLGGILSFFQLQDKIYSSRKALADLRLECQMYDHCIDEYKDRHTDPERAHLIFSKKVTAIQARQMLHEVELLNPKKKETAPETREETQENRKKEEEGQSVEKGQSDEETTK